MKTVDSPLGPKRIRKSAMKCARQLALDTGAPSMVYYRPLDDAWFVLGADDPPPLGPTIKVEVRS